MTTYQADAGFTGEEFPVGAMGQTTTWIYDGDVGDPDGVDNGTGLLVAKLDAAGKGASYSYGTGGRLASRTWARGGSTTYGYDPATGELLTVDYSDAGTPDIGYTYDSLGRQATVADAMGVRTFSYDPATLQLASESIDAADPADDVVLTRKYETGAENFGVRGRAAGLYLDDASKYNLTYGYSGVGRFDRVHFDVGDGQSNTVDQATYSYVSNSNLLGGMTTSSGQATTYQYESTRDLKTRVKNVFDDGNGANTVSQYDYRYDELGRRTDVVTSGGAFGGSGNEELSLWGYNDRNELTASTRHAGSNPVSPGAEVTDEKRSYLYDPIGNRKTALSQDGTTPITYTANQLNQYDLIDAAVPTYDDDGNMTADGEGKTLVYNGENRLVAFDDGAGTTASYEYDYIGRRVKKTVGAETTTYVWDDWNLIRERTDDGLSTSTKHNVWGLDLSQSMQGAGGIGGLIAVIDGGGQAKLFAYDGNGNVGQVVAPGVVDASYEYDAFGNVVAMAGAGAEDNAWRFSTKAVDAESGYSYYGYRYYDAEMGTWNRRDPVGEGGGINLYGFVTNGPVNSADLLGLYQEAGHFYTTYAVAISSGEYSASDAFKLAYYSQLPDEFAPLDAMTAGFGTKLSHFQNKIQKYLQSDFRNLKVPPEHVTAFGRDVQEWLHSLHGGGASSVADRRACLSKMLGRGDLAIWQKGFITHALGDAFAHTFTDATGVNAYKYPYGHASDGEDPDNIAARPDVYRAYVARLFGALKKGRENIGQLAVLLDYVDEIPVSHESANLRVGAFVRSRFDYVGDFDGYRPEAGEVLYEGLPTPSPEAVHGLFRDMKSSCGCN